MEDKKISSLVDQLQQKYGSNLPAHLEGLLHTDLLKYWDYIAVDTLLTLQKPKTDIPDEMIFIMYHQVTELYFKMILWEVEQISALEANVEAETFLVKMKRSIRYMEILAHSFDVMVHGMDVEQFRQFRMSLLSASGFQSAQFRQIEMCMTELRTLVDADYQPMISHNTTTKELYEHIYWKRGATEMESKRKTSTLKHFEEKYDDLFLKWAYQYRDINVWKKYLQIDERNPLKEEIKQTLRIFDRKFNIEWTLSHLKAASHYLRPKGSPIKATGGTNWTKYLPPNLQKRIFFPDLWSEDEKERWAKDIEVDWF